MKKNDHFLRKVTGNKNNKGIRWAARCKVLESEKNPFNNLKGIKDDYNLQYLILAYALTLDESRPISRDGSSTNNDSIVSDKIFFEYLAIKELNDTLDLCNQQFFCNYKKIDARQNATNKKNKIQEKANELSWRALIYNTYEGFFIRPQKLAIQIIFGNLLLTLIPLVLGIVDKFNLIKNFHLSNRFLGIPPLFKGDIMSRALQFSGYAFVIWVILLIAKLIFNNCIEKTPQDWEKLSNGFNKKFVF